MRVTEDFRRGDSVPVCMARKHDHALYEALSCNPVIRHRTRQIKSAFLGLMGCDHRAVKAGCFWAGSRSAWVDGRVDGFSVVMKPWVRIVERDGCQMCHCD